MRYRLAWGLVVDMHIPSLETKIAILTKKAELHGVALSDDVAHFIASCNTHNIRELEGSLIRVIAFASLTAQSIDLSLAQRVLMRSLEPMRNRVNFDGIIKYLSKQYPYSLHDLRSANRNKELTLVRQIAMFLMKKITDKSLRDIGFFLGGRDHSTVMHALEKIQQQVQNNTVFAQQLKQFEEEIMGGGY